MKVLVVGSTGALGVPTIRALRTAGHEVWGLTRSSEKARRIEELGARAALGDVFDPGAMNSVFEEVRPEGVLQLLNALPKRGPFKPKDLEETNRLRIEGTKNVLGAAIGVGTRRFVAESMIFGYGYGKHGDLITEDKPFVRQADFEGAQGALDGLNSLEDQVRAATEAGRIEGVVLRYGLFYGPDVGSTDFMLSLLRKRMFILPGGGHATGSWIHISDGAEAAVLALERARPGAVYNVVDDEPASLRAIAAEMSTALGLPKPKQVPLWVARLAGRYAALMAQSELRVSNERMKKELDWEPAYPTYREGVRSLVPPGRSDDARGRAA